MSLAQNSLLRLRPDVAFQGYFPSPGNSWDLARVAHLYRRAAFGGSWGQLMAGVESTPDRLVDALTQPIEASERAFDADIERLSESVLASGEPRQLKGLWLYRMALSPFPLRERLTLFWHDHFATSNAKVRSLALMQRQNDTLRRHALGHFGELLQEMTRDPAMLRWLDSNTNRKGNPNENYAREVFELFSLGVGHYTEKDIQEAARALTGWSVRDDRAVFNPAEFDAGEKTILGETGPWAAGDVVRIALGQKACSRFLVKKLFAEFISETVTLPDDYIEPLAEEFRVRNYDIGWLVTRLLRSWVFFSPAAMGQRIKSPIEFLIGAVRSLEGHASPLQLADLADQMGQSPYYPPSVKGWDGGANWLNSTTLLFRQNAAFELTRGAGLGTRCDPAVLIDRHLSEATPRDGNAPSGLLNGSDRDEQIARFFLNLFHQDPDMPALTAIVDHLQSERLRLNTEGHSPAAVDRFLARIAAHLAMTLPEFQLG